MADIFIPVAIGFIGSFAANIQHDAEGELGDIATIVAIALAVACARYFNV